MSWCSGLRPITHFRRIFLFHISGQRFTAILMSKSKPNQAYIYTLLQTKYNLLDSSRNTSQNSYASLRRLNGNLHAFHLVDVWRVLHPNQKDYTFFSRPHNSYTRIDTLMVPQSLLSRVASALIVSVTFSDLAPVFVDVDLLRSTRKQWTWRLNDSLTQSPEIVGELRHYFSTNVTPEVHSTIVWKHTKATLEASL